MSGSSVVVGIDVASQHVDVAVLGAQLGTERFCNDVDGHTALATALAPLKPQLVRQHRSHHRVPAAPTRRR